MNDARRCRLARVKVDRVQHGSFIAYGDLYLRLSGAGQLWYGTCTHVYEMGLR